MNFIQRVKLTMYMAVKDFLNLNATIVANLPNYTQNFTVVTNNIITIQATGEQQEFDKSGISDNKKLLRSTLILQAADISRKMVAYAKNVGNAVLLKEIKYTESELKHAPDADLKNMTQCIYDRANSNVTVLGTYNITAAMLTSLQTAITNFNTSIPKVTEGTVNKKLSTAQLASLYKATDKALDNIDTIIEIVRVSQPNFYAGYKNMRKVNETGKGSIAVKGSVSDATTLELLKGATLSFYLDGGMAKAKAANIKADIVKKTAEKGGFTIKSLAAGIYTVVISKNGYQDQVVTIAVSVGEMSELHVQLVKN